MMHVQCHHCGGGARLNFGAAIFAQNLIDPVTRHVMSHNRDSFMSSLMGMHDLVLSVVSLLRHCTVVACITLDILESYLKVDQVLNWHLLRRIHNQETNHHVVWIWAMV